MLLQRLLRAGEGRTLKRLHAIAKHINDLEDDIEALSDGELAAKTDEFKKRYADGEDLDELLPEAFAVVREAAKRTLGQRHFDVQLMGGAALHFGLVAEMKTGEGKTLAATLPSYLNAISGKGVHVVTVNDYLVKRDAEWMGRIHEFLGLEVGAILAQMPPNERREAYAADITYGTNNEFGFDYLRDNMAHSLDDCVQRGHNYAIVDEVDSILIDEARTPLIISGPAEQSSRWYTEFARLVPRMRRDVHYEVDEKKRTVGVTEEGVLFIEDQLGVENLYEAANTPLVGYLNNAIKSKELFKRDRDYIVRGGEVLIVDEHTGRVLHGRRYNEGMHQAIEAKEGVEIKAENQTLATITLQNYFRLYDKLAGMTGTAQTEAAELHQIYKLGVVSIPTNKPMIRIDQADLVYKTEEAKFAAVVDDIAERHEKGQPVLVGTTSVAKSEYLSKQLIRQGIPHEVLNAKHHEREATIIAQAGQRGAVTIATNMAGRGTDIVLGGGEAGLAGDPAHEQALRIATQAAEKRARDAAEKEVAPVVDAAGERALDEIEPVLADLLRVADQVKQEEAEARRPGGQARASFEAYEARDKQYERFNQKVQVAVRQTLTGRKVKPAAAESIAEHAADRALTKAKNVLDSPTKRGRKGEDNRARDIREGVRKTVHEIVHDAAFAETFAKLRKDLFDKDTYDRTYAEEHAKASTSRKEIVELGGLYVLGTERHESRRIDNQLRGRSGRQGDPGESRFYLSLGDDLMRRFNSAMVEAVMTRLNMPEDVPIEAKMVTKAIQSAQTQVEQQNFEIRKNVLKYDEVMNRQRTVIYTERRRVLEGEDLREQIQHMMDDVITAYVDGATSGGYAEDWDLDQLWTALRLLYPISIRWQDLADAEDDLTRDVLLRAILEDVHEAYGRHEADIESRTKPGFMRELERYVMLQVLDRKWREHLYEMDYLKEGIGLRAMAQRDPLIEYQREGFDMFSAMLDALKEECVGQLFHMQVRMEPAPEAAPAGAGAGLLADATAPLTGNGAGAPPGTGDGQAGRPLDAIPPALRGRGAEPPDQSALTYSGPAEDGTTDVQGTRRAAGGKHRAGAAVGGGKEPSRNAPCPCGSGKKYKRCHGAPTTAHP